MKVAIAEPSDVDTTFVTAYRVKILDADNNSLVFQRRRRESSGKINSDKRVSRLEESVDVLYVESTVLELSRSVKSPTDSVVGIDES